MLIQIILNIILIILIFKGNVNMNVHHVYYFLMSLN